MAKNVRNIHSKFVVMGPGFDVTPVLFTPEMFDGLDARFDEFRGHLLISAFTFEQDWPTWEVHPNGDEVVLLLSGDITMVLRLPDGEAQGRLSKPGTYIVVPRGVWHTGRTDSSAKVLFITPGEGTVNAPQPD